MMLNYYSIEKSMEIAKEKAKHLKTSINLIMRMAHTLKSMKRLIIAQ